MTLVRRHSSRLLWLAAAFVVATTHTIPSFSFIIDTIRLGRSIPPLSWKAATAKNHPRQASTSTAAAASTDVNPRRRHNPQWGWNRKISPFVDSPAVWLSSRGGGADSESATDDTAVVDSTNTMVAGDAQSSNTVPLPLDVPLIPRSVLFGNPSFASPILSPDGTKLAYLAPSTDFNVLNVWIRYDMNMSTRAHEAAAAVDRQVTNDTVRGIRSVTWAQDSTHILYLQDEAGDENFHVYVVDTTWSGNDTDNDKSSIPTARDLTPGVNVKASTIVTNEHYPHEILVATNQRNASCFDMYRCRDIRAAAVPSDDDAASALELDTMNPGDVIGWGCSNNDDEDGFAVRLAVVRNAVDSSTTIRVRTVNRNDQGDEEEMAPSLSDWHDVITFPYGEEGGLVDFVPHTNYAYLTSSLGRDTKALLKVKVDIGTTQSAAPYNEDSLQTQEVIASSDVADIGRIALSTDGLKTVQAVTFNYARTERTFFNETLAAHYEFLQSRKVVMGPNFSNNTDDVEVSIASRSRDDGTWIVAYSRSNGPTEYVVYRPFLEHDQRIEPLFVSRPELVPYVPFLQPMTDVRIPTRDGLELVAYLTRATATDGSSRDTTTASTPLVLLVHGGPWARDYWGYSAQAQWLANRGYAVLQVNFRGSTGYGKSFLHKGDGQWGVGTMQHDLTDAVTWAIQQGIADCDKICIYGGSYGGYACLAGLTFTPDVYACGVDIVGPSNVKTLLDSIPPYWGPLRNGMLRKIGNVDADAEFNEQISPLFHIDQIQAPLLIGHGANDPRVKQAEADQIAYAMQAKGIDVEYVLYPDEGHGFARPDNRIDFNGRAELFLQKHLGGRAEAFVRPPGSTAVFPLEK